MEEVAVVEEPRGALNVLIEDCWWLVFQQLDSRDLKSCYQTCSDFRRMLEGKEPTWKLGEVLSVLFNWLDAEEGKPSLCFCSGFIQCPHGHAAGPNRWKPMLECRLVCRAWCVAVDQHLQNHHGSGSYPGERVPVSYYFQSSPQIETFLEQFRNCTANPFISRKVSFKLSQTDIGFLGEGRRYAQKLQELGERFGGEIWTTSLEQEGGTTFIPNYISCRRMLSRLPNLRRLNIRGNWEDESQEGWEGVRAVMEELPLPPLPLLKRLSFSYDVSLEMKTAMMEKYVGQLQDLEMCFDEGFLTERMMGWMSSLRKLSFTSFSINSTKTLRCLRWLHSPLEELTCDISGGDARGTELWPMDSSLENVRHLPLTKLTVRTDGPFVGKSGQDQPIIKHEGVRHLQIECTRGKMQFSADVLLLFPNVEAVQFEFRLDDAPAGEEVAYHPLGLPDGIQLLGLLVTGDVYGSNVWELVPSLKDLRVKLSRFTVNGRRAYQHLTRRYSRKGYEKWRAEREN